MNYTTPLLILGCLFSFYCNSQPTTTVTTFADIFYPELQYYGSTYTYDGTAFAVIPDIKLSFCFVDHFDPCECYDSTFSNITGSYSLHSDRIWVESGYLNADYYVVASDVDGTENGGYFLEQSVYQDSCFEPSVNKCVKPLNFNLNATDDPPVLVNENCTTTTTL